MAEIVEFRVEKTLEELSTLVELGLFTTRISKEILSKRQNFEYALRRRTRSKLDFLRYIKYEMNLLDAIEKYRNTVIGDYFKSRKEKEEENLEKKILMLKGKRLNEVIRNRAAHISSLFLKLTTSFQFDKELWFAYIEFAKRRKWNTRVTALYWRVLRVIGDEEDIWVEATNHEVKINRSYDVARGLYLRAIRHFPKSVNLWSNYFNMEVDFMTLIHRRAQVLMKVDKGSDEPVLDVDEEQKECEEEDAEKSAKNEDIHGINDKDGEKLPNAKAILEDSLILSGELPRVVFKNACNSLSQNTHLRLFIVKILKNLINSDLQTENIQKLRDFVCNEIVQRHNDGDCRFGESLVKVCQKQELSESLEKLEPELIAELDARPNVKRFKTSEVTDSLDECFGSKGIEETRTLFKSLEKSVKNQTLSLYTTMLEIEYMVLLEDKKLSNDEDYKKQVKTIRTLFEKATSKFGKDNAELWIQFMKFEYCNAKQLEDVKRVSNLYQKAILSLAGQSLNKVVEGYALIQAKRIDCNELIRFS